MQSESESLRRIDRVILEELRSRKLEYPTVIASRQEEQPIFIKIRCEKLENEEYLECVSEESVYRITQAGTERIRNESPSGTER